MNKSNRTVLVVFLAFTLLSIMSIVYAQGTMGYINAEGISLRAQPSTDSKVIRELKKGDRIESAGSKDPHEADSWVEVSISRTNEHGYVLAQYITTGPIASNF
jgi:uncharacterized protein YraI